jgi:hypothetical protein
MAESQGRVIFDRRNGRLSAVGGSFGRAKRLFLKPIAWPLNSHSE